MEILDKNKPNVILIAGVNGVGKTTTMIGKLGKILSQNNKKIVFGAADTFRAARCKSIRRFGLIKLMLKLLNQNEGMLTQLQLRLQSLDYAKKNDFDYLIN